MPGPIPQNQLAQTRATGRSMSLQNVIPTGIPMLNTQPPMNNGRRHTVGAMSDPNTMPHPGMVKQHQNFQHQHSAPPSATAGSQSPSFRRRQFDPNTHETVPENGALTNVRPRETKDTNGYGPQSGQQGPDPGMVVKTQR